MSKRGYSKKGGKGGWKIITSFPSNTCMRYTFISRRDLEPVIANAPGARLAFVMKYHAKVVQAANRVNAKRQDKTSDDVYMELWEHVFDRDCRVLRAYSEKSSLEAYICTCLGHKAMSIASDITRDAEHLANQVECSLCNPHENQQDNDEEDARFRARLLKSANALVKSLPSEKGRFFTRAFVDCAPTETLKTEFGLGSDNAVYQWKNRMRARLGSLAKTVCPVNSMH